MGNTTAVKLEICSQYQWYRADFFNVLMCNEFYITIYDALTLPNRLFWNIHQYQNDVFASNCLDITKLSKIL